MGLSHQRSRRGFSLVELVFGFLIVALLLGLTATNLRMSVQQEGPRGLAYTLASDLRAARTEAQRSGKLVAFCFPSEGRTNSLFRSAVLRKGDQRGLVSRVLGYGDEYEATVFLGTWPGSTTSTTDISAGWSLSTADSIAIFFRPDGSAFSNELPAVNGNYPVVVASSFVGNFSGSDGIVARTKNPHTIWVSQSGSVSVSESTTPAGTLPLGESELTVAELDLSNEPSPTSPQLVSVKFLPERIDGLDVASIGQNYVSVHPNQKEGGYLEYGVATIELKVTDTDGGPLHYTLEAEASAGDEGKFTVSDMQGDLRYVYDQAERRHLWHAVISWRPPPGASPDLVYDLTVAVRDPQNNVLEISSGAGLIPSVTSLPPARVVVSTQEKNLFLTNLDGANEIKVTKSGAEYLPFFSADGSRFFSFHDDGARRELRARTANGTSSYDRLASFDIGGGTVVKYDPTFTYAAIINRDGTETYPWQYVVDPPSTEDDDPPPYVVNRTSYPAKYSIVMVNLMSDDPPFTVTNRSTGNFRWAPHVAGSEEFGFYYEQRRAADPVNDSGFTIIPMVDDVPGPNAEKGGWVLDEVSGYKALTGYPPVIGPGADFDDDASDRIYNPASPEWYLQVKGTGPSPKELVIGKQGGSEEVLHTGSIQNDPEWRRVPSWSADGQEIAFIDGNRVIGMKVLRPDGADDFERVTNTIKFDRNEPGASMAQLSPEGRWIYYVKAGKLWRAVNTSGNTPVDISKAIGSGIDGFAISP